MPAVRQTESRIPYGDPHRLGEVGSLVYPAALADAGCCLVSYLTAPITMSSTNTYVVFVTGTALAGQVASYEWSVTEDLGPGASEAKLVAPLDDHPAVLEYVSVSAVPIVVRVSLKDGAGETLRELQLRQVVRPPYQALERLIQTSNVTIKDLQVPRSSAAGLAPATSREVLNDLFGYIRDAFEGSTASNKVPLRFLAAVVWLQAHRVPKNKAATDADVTLDNQLRNTELESVGALLNGEGPWAYATDLHNAVGVTQIRASTAAMFLDKPPAAPPPSAAATEPYTQRVLLPLDEKMRDAKRQEIIDNYVTGTDLTAKTDLYNLLRFPKSNIRTCFEILNALKNRSGRYSTVTTEPFFGDDDAVAIIATEFAIGATDAVLAQAQPNDFGKAVARVIGSPVFSLGFGDNLDLIVEGEVHDEADATASMAGARVDVYLMMLRVDQDQLPCYRRFEGIPTAPDTEKELLGLGDNLSVLEVRRRSPSGYPNDDLVKVRRVSNKLDLNEGWVVVKSGPTWNGTLSSQRVESVAIVGSDNRFKFAMHAPQPLFIRTVKEPVGVLGYFDGELGRVTQGLPPGWVLPPAANLVIRQKSVRHMVRESVLVDRLGDWLNYSYATNLVPDYPAGYVLPTLVPSIHQYWFEDQPNPAQPSSTISVQVNADHQIACNTFVEALVIEAWAVSFGATFTWSLKQHQQAMFQELEWFPAPVDSFNPEIDPFSPAWVYVERVIDVTQNPTVGQNFTVRIHDIDVAVIAGATNVETATNIAAAIRANAAAAQRVTVIRGISTRSFVTIRPATEASDRSLLVRIQSASGAFALFPSGDAAIFPAVRLDLAAGTLPPPWTLVEGWAQWAPKPPPPKWRDIEGHNLILVSIDPKSGKVLTLEANLPSAKIGGVGFRGMGNSADAGNVDNYQLPTGGISPNVRRHWLETVSATWDGLRAYYSGRTDGTNPMGLARLKVYDCRWAQPYLYETTF